MYPCSNCNRHLHETDSACPFCATEQRIAVSPESSLGSLRASVGAFVLVAATMLGSIACAKDNVSADSQHSGSSDDTTTATESGEDTDSTSSTQGDTTDSASATTNTSGSFYAVPEGDMMSISECDSFAQDCPEGEKCVPYADISSTWDANKCVPITGAGEPGDPCVSGGIFEGTDDCDAASFCWHVMDVEGQPLGVCTAFCQGTIDEPVCPDDTSCFIANEVTIVLCLEICDPLAQDCDPGLGCYWGNNDFNCVDGPKDTALGEPCAGIADCVPGLACLDASVMPNCDGLACCGSFCSLSQPACPQPGTECSMFFEMDTPPGYEDIGVCILPIP